jgi:hypothetical protein
MPTPQAPTPDQFLSGFPALTQALAHRTRALVSGVLPEATEQVRLGWQLLGLYVPGRARPVYVGFIIPHADYVTLGFEYGILLADPTGVLLGAQEKLKQVRYLTLNSDEAIGSAALPPLIRQAAEVALMPAGLRKPMLRAARVQAGV